MQGRIAKIGLDTRSDLQQPHAPLLILAAKDLRVRIVERKRLAVFFICSVPLIGITHHPGSHL